jgi:hypothetical protein
MFYVQQTEQHQATATPDELLQYTRRHEFTRDHPHSHKQLSFLQFITEEREK